MFKTPGSSMQDRYRNDPEFHRLVDYMYVLIADAQFTGAEVRQAAMMACINYHMYNLEPMRVIPDDIERSIQVIDNFVCGDR